VVGRTFEFVAGLGGAMLAASFLQDSMDAYKQAGLHDDAERIRRAMQGAIRDSKDEMTQYSMPIEIPKKVMDDTIVAVVVDDVGQTFANIAAAFIPKVAAMEAQVAKLAEEAPLFSMLPQQIFAEDHVAAKVGSVEDDESGRLLRQTVRTLQINLAFLHACMHAAIDRHELKPHDFAQWANRQGLIEGGKVALLEDGLQAWFDQDYVKALHVLIPQIENALRRMVDQVGKPTTKPAGTVPGVSVAINMGDILFNAGTVAALGPLGPDFALYMKAIYADPRGMNLRNQFAHGLLDAEEIHEGSVLWLVHTLLVVGAWRKPV
jgi:lysyl-tRNA synthetase class 1